MSDPTPTTPEAQAQARFGKRLLTRLKKRPTTDGAVYTLDLRSKQFAGVGSDRLTVYCPDDPEWPKGGRTTEDLSVAQRWVEQRYVSWIWEQCQLASTTRDASAITWRQGAQRYVDSFKVLDSRPDGTVVETIPRSKQSRVSMIRRHIKPRFGHLPMAALDRETVGKAAKCLRVIKAGTKARTDGAYGTQLNFKAALLAIWKFNFPYRAAPFAGIKIEAPAIVGTLSTEVFEWDDESGLGEDSTGALDHAQLKLALTAAMWYDLDRIGRPNLVGMMIPNTAYAMALQATLGTRISEELNIRWGHINFKQLYVRIYNAKVHQVRVQQRAVPLQISLIPWLEELRAMDERLHPNGFVIRTDPNAPATTPGALTSIARRIGVALELAGLKQPRKQTHGLRATYASILDQSDAISAKMVRRYLGHQAVYGTSTDRYVRQLISEMKESHRHLIKLPTPKEVRAALADFKPVELPDWKEKKKPWPRTKKAIEERSRRPKRVPLGASLDLPPGAEDQNL